MLNLLLQMKCQTTSSSSMHQLASQNRASNVSAEMDSSIQIGSSRGLGAISHAISANSLSSMPTTKLSQKHATISTASTFISHNLSDTTTSPISMKHSFPKPPLQCSEPISTATFASTLELSSIVTQPDYQVIAINHANNPRFPSQKSPSSHVTMHTAKNSAPSSILDGALAVLGQPSYSGWMTFHASDPYTTSHVYFSMFATSGIHPDTPYPMCLACQAIYLFLVSLLV
jgi:hypothetical protein